MTTWKNIFSKFSNLGNKSKSSNSNNNRKKSKLKLRRPKSHDPFSEEITDALQSSASTSDKTVFMLLLGPGGSGKSTILKQLEMIYNAHGIPAEVLQDACLNVHQNILSDIHDLCTTNITMVVNNAECRLEHFANEQKAATIACTQKQAFVSDRTIDCVEAMELDQIWNDPGMKNTFEIHKKSAVMDNSAYFFDHLQRICADDYDMTYEDYLRARIQTTGILDYTFTVANMQQRHLSTEQSNSSKSSKSKSSTSQNSSGGGRGPDDDDDDDDNKDGEELLHRNHNNSSGKSLSSAAAAAGDNHNSGGKQPGFTALSSSSSKHKKTTKKQQKQKDMTDGWRLKITDVGGQRSERKKWFKCFTDVNAMIYVMSLSDYDTVLWEDEQQNCMQESFDVFARLMNERALRNVDVIVILNKLDVFREKIVNTPFEMIDNKELHFDATRVSEEMKQNASATTSTTALPSKPRVAQNHSKSGSRLALLSAQSHSNSTSATQQQQQQPSPNGRYNHNHHSNNNNNNNNAMKNTNNNSNSNRHGNSHANSNPHQLPRLQQSQQSQQSSDRFRDGCVTPAIASLTTLADVEEYVVFQLRKRFLRATNQKRNPRKFISYHITCALDTVDIETVFRDIYETFMTPYMLQKRNT